MNLNYENYNKKLKDNATEIVVIFEKFLNERQVVIPNSEKEENSHACNIYGTDFADLQDSILEVLADAFPGPNMPFDKWEFDLVKRENDDLKSEITTLKETIVRIMKRYVDIL